MFELEKSVQAERVNPVLSIPHKCDWATGQKFRQKAAENALRKFPTRAEITGPRREQER
jgi:hypothetical protein